MRTIFIIKWESHNGNYMVEAFDDKETATEYFKAGFNAYGKSGADLTTILGNEVDKLLSDADVQYHGTKSHDLFCSRPFEYDKSEAEVAFDDGFDNGLDPLERYIATHPQEDEGAHCGCEDYPCCGH